MISLTVPLGPEKSCKRADRMLILQLVNAGGETSRLRHFLGAYLPQVFVGGRTFGVNCYIFFSFGLEGLLVLALRVVFAIFFSACACACARRNWLGVRLMTAGCIMRGLTAGVAIGWVCR